jgi:hypothetical protein
MIQVSFINTIGLMGYGIDYVGGRSYANMLMATSCNGNDWSAVKTKQMEMDKDGQAV